MRIDHVNIVCADLEKTVSFYETLFQMKRGFSAELKGDWIEGVTGLPGAHARCQFLEAPEGGTRLELIQYILPLGAEFSPNSLPNTRGLRHLAFEVADMDLLLLKLNELGVQVLGPAAKVPFPVANLGEKWLVYFLDPDGSIVEAAAYRAASVE